MSLWLAFPENDTITVIIDFVKMLYSPTCEWASSLRCETEKLSAQPVSKPSAQTVSKLFCE